jgi:hypothetical protein
LIDGLPVEAAFRVHLPLAPLALLVVCMGGQNDIEIIVSRTIASPPEGPVCTLWKCPVSEGC